MGVRSAPLVGVLLLELEGLELELELEELLLELEDDDPPEHVTVVDADDVLFPGTGSVAELLAIAICVLNGEPQV